MVILLIDPWFSFQYRLWQSLPRSAVQQADDYYIWRIRSFTPTCLYWHENVRIKVATLSNKFSGIMGELLVECSSEDLYWAVYWNIIGILHQLLKCKHPISHHLDQIYEYKWDNLNNDHVWSRSKQEIFPAVQTQLYL